jgi:hypothetical protein
MTRTLVAVAAVLVATGLFAPPAQAQAGTAERRQAHTHVAIGVSPFEASYLVTARLTRKGTPYSDRLLVIQARRGQGPWQKTGPKQRTSATGLTSWVITDPALASAYSFRVLFKGTGRARPSHSRPVRLPRSARSARVGQAPLRMSRISWAVSDGVLPTLTPAASRASFLP